MIKRHVRSPSGSSQQDVDWIGWKMGEGVGGQEREGKKGEWDGFAVGRGVMVSACLRRAAGVARRAGAAVASEV